MLILVECIHLTQIFLICDFFMSTYVFVTYSQHKILSLAKDFRNSWPNSKK